MTATHRSARRQLAGVAVLAWLLSAPLAAAQYMYLDSNGDGLHLGDDRVNASGPTTIDIWLDTDSNRDGSAAVCDLPPGDLDLGSYEFVLQSVGGTVVWGAFTNALAAFSVDLKRDSRDTSGNVFYHNGWGGNVPLAPGLYKLGSMSATIQSGNPSINIVTQHNINRTSRTTFGTACVANPTHDHTNRFGVNWGDADGLASPTDVAPIVTAPGMVLPTDGAQVQFTVTANDPDPGDALQSLTALVSGLPPGHDATFAANGSFTSGTFTWTPTASDSGNYTVTFAAANILTGRRQTIVHVVGTPSGVDPTAAPGVTRLEQNRPNPFRPGTEIPYRLAAEGTVRLAVYDPNGRLVRVISSGRESAGPHVARWDGRDAGGRSVASGIYLIRLEAEGVLLTRRMLLLR